eukprot:c11427_g1_i1.p1 GENE.c11427_g1_i1~~c11427_g1_i1.p1  ORF type:complete len:218 (+),score=59.13 c11427_g1_i1:115-768(+)
MAVLSLVNQHEFIPPKDKIVQVKIARIVFVALLIVLFYAIATEVHRGCSLVGACFFFCVETTWLSITTTDKNGLVHFTGIRKNHIHFSSLAQWWANVFVAPIFVFGYRALFPSSVGVWLMVLLFPLNIWLFEITVGYSLMFLFGRNVAWYYHGPATAFHGNIKLKYFGQWLLLGTTILGPWEFLTLPLFVRMGPFHEIVVLVMLVVTTFRYRKHLPI